MDGVQCVRGGGDYFTYVRTKQEGENNKKKSKKEN
jgi:hypothetical protein